MLAAIVVGCSSGAPRSADADGADAGAGDTAGDEAGGAVLAEYDLGGEFSIANNPNGPWRYGHTPDPALAATGFLLDGFTVDSPPVGFWHPSDADYYPYVAGNESQATAVDPTNSWAVRAREVAMEASQDARYSVVQFVAPAAANYEIQADFTGIHFRLSSTDVHVLQGDTPIFDAQIDGYGGDPAFHALEGQNPHAGYHATLALVVGDRLSFAVGVGQDGTYNNDTTGLMVHLIARD